MAIDAFLYFPGQSLVVGEALDDEMQKQKAFAIETFTFGAENVINIGSDSEGGGAGKAVFEPFNLTKKCDTASCGLFHTLACGTHFDEAILELRRSGGSAERAGATFLKFHFRLVMVGKVEWSGSEDGVEETIELHYGAMKIEYFRQDKTGKLAKATGGQGEAKWSRVLNKAVYAVNK
ncbi:MAG: type VI secretion system tube protein Hcp [Pseudomonadota bacterium]